MSSTILESSSNVASKNNVIKYTANVQRPRFTDALFNGYTWYGQTVDQKPLNHLNTATIYSKESVSFISGSSCINNPCTFETKKEDEDVLLRVMNVVSVMVRNVFSPFHLLFTIF